jgi:peroxiredoxin family protein
MTIDIYTSDELAKIAEAVMITGLAVAMVETGIISTAIEANALAKEVAKGAVNYPNNDIIQTLLSQEALEKTKVNPPAKIEIPAEDLQPEAVIDTAIKIIQEALVILDAKAKPEDIQGYKEFIYNCAETVANASGSGLFGTGSPKVSSQEAAALSQLKAFLEI